jgi:hypothetical protein
MLRTMFSAIAALFALTVAPSARAGTITLSTATITAAPAQSLQCYLTNTGTASFTAAAPNTTIKVQVIDRTGADITSASAGGCLHATLDPGQTCGMFADSGVFQEGHCKFTFKGSKKAARANALLQDNLTFGTVTVLPAN